MTLDALIMLLGAFVALLPFLGFPNSWDTVLLLTTGVLFVVLGIIVRRRISSKNAGAPPRAFVDTSSMDHSKHDTP